MSENRQLVPVGGSYVPPAVVEDSPAGERRVAWIFGGAFFIGFLGWAALTPLDAGAYARGVVAVAGNRQAVQHREGGVVAALNVREGQRVTKGQPLMTVGRTTIEASERGLTREALMLYAERARLLAERAGLGSVPAPIEFAGLTATDRAIADEALRAQQGLMLARRSAIASQKEVHAQQARQAAARIGGYEAQVIANRDQRKSVEQELVGMRSLAEKGFASMTRIRQLERASAAIEGEVGNYTAQIAEAREAIGQARMQALVLDRTTIQEIDQRLREVNGRINEIAPQQTAADERLANTVLRAPASGRIVNLAVFTVGGVINPAQTLMEVVPDDQELVVQAQLSPDDIDDVAPGMVTEVKFPSLRDANLPVVEGTLRNVSADAVTEERSGATYFAAEVRVPASGLREIAKARPGSPAVQPGVPVEVLVKLQPRTMLSYLIEPLTRMMWRTGREH